MRATKGAGYRAADFALQARRGILFFLQRGAVEDGPEREKGWGAKRAGMIKMDCFVEGGGSW